MHRWHSGVVVFVAGLILHASVLAAMPLIWCVGAHGHNAIEFCADTFCHHSQAVEATGRASPKDGRPLGAVLADAAHSAPCIDSKPIDPQLAPQVEPAAAAPVVDTHSGTTRNHQQFDGASGRSCVLAATIITTHTLLALPFSHSANLNLHRRARSGA